MARALTEKPGLTLRYNRECQVIATATFVAGLVGISADHKDGVVWETTKGAGDLIWRQIVDNDKNRSGGNGLVANCVEGKEGPA